MPENSKSEQSADDQEEFEQRELGGAFAFKG